MPTECSAERFQFREAAGRVVVAGYDARHRPVVASQFADIDRRSPDLVQPRLGQ